MRSDEAIGREMFEEITRRLREQERGLRRLSAELERLRRDMNRLPPHDPSEGSWRPGRGERTWGGPAFYEKAGFPGEEGV